MPPRHAYWTIILEGKPTAFRTHTRDELLPTFKQLQARHSDIQMKWFARGRLWESPDEERAAARRRGEERRGPSWRPGGSHEDPRERFQVPRDEKRRRFAAKLRRDRPAGGSSGPAQGDAGATGPPRSTPAARPTGPRGANPPTGPRAAAARKPGPRPPGLRPGGPSASRPSGPSSSRPSGPPRSRPSGPSGSRPSGPSGSRPSGPPRSRPSGPPGSRPSGPSGSRPGGPPGSRPGGPPGSRPFRKPGPPRGGGRNGGGRGGGRPR
jgi:hypothetical protein